MPDYKELLVRLTADIQDYLDKMEKADKQTDKFKTSAAGMGSAISKGAKAGLTAFLAAASAVVVGTEKMIKSTLEYGGQLNDLSKKTGLSVERLQEMKYMCEQLDGNFDSLRQMATNLTMRLAGVADGLEKPTEAIEAIGGEIYNTNGSIKDMNQLLPELLKKLADMPPSMERNIYAQKLFGKSFMDVLPLLQEGSAGIDKYMERAHKFGLLTSDQVKQIDDFNDRLADMGAAWQGIKNTITTSALPALTTLAKIFEENWTSIEKTVSFGTAAVTGAFSGLGSYIAERFAPSVAFFMDLLDKKLSTFVSNTNKNATAQQKIMAFFAMVTQNAMISLENALHIVIFTILDIFVALYDGIRWVANGLQNIYLGMIKGVNWLAEQMVSGLNWVLEKIYNFLEYVNAPSWAMEKIQNGMNALSGTMSRLQRNVEAVNFIPMQTGLLRLANPLKDLQKFKTFNEILQQITKGSKDGGETTNNLAAGIATVGNNAVKATKELDEYIGSVVSFIDSVADLVKNTLKSIYEYNLEVYRIGNDHMKKALDEQLEENLWFIDKVEEEKIKALERDRERIQNEYNYKNQLAEQEYNDTIDSLEAEQSKTSEFREEFKRQRKIEHEERLKLIDDEKTAKIKAIDDKIKALDKEAEAEDKYYRVKGRKENIASLMEEAKKTTDPEERKKLLKQLEDIKIEIEREKNSERRSRKKELLQAEKEEEEKVNKAKREAENKNYENVELIISKQEKKEDEAFKRRRDQAKQHYDYLVNENNLWLEEQTKAIDKVINYEKFVFEGQRNEQRAVMEEHRKLIDAELAQKQKEYDTATKEDSLNAMVIGIIKTKNAKKWLDSNAPGWDKTTKSIGEQLIEGVTTGLKDPAKIKNGVNSFVDTFLKELKKYFKISSPSEVAKDEIGKPIGEGIIEGTLESIDDGSSEVNAAINALVSGAIKGIGSAVGSTSPSVDSSGKVSFNWNGQDMEFSSWEEYQAWGNKVATEAVEADRYRIQQQRIYNSAMREKAWYDTHLFTNQYDPVTNPLGNKTNNWGSGGGYDPSQYSYDITVITQDSSASEVANAVKGAIDTVTFNSGVVP